VIDRTREHARQLGGAEALLEPRQRAFGLGDDPGVVLGGPQLEEDPRVVDVANELLDALDLLLEPGALARDGLRLVRVVPETGR
jgi:hypothetical protein